MPTPVQHKKNTWKILWDTNVTSVAAPAAGGGKDNRELVTAAELEDLDDRARVIRVIGDIHFVVGEATVATESAWLAFGLGVVPGGFIDDQIALSSLADIQDFPWMWLRTFMFYGASQITGEIGSNENGFGGGNGIDRHVDVKSGRLMEEGSRLVLFTDIRNNDASVARTLDYSVNLRILLQA